MEAVRQQSFSVHTVERNRSILIIAACFNHNQRFYKQSVHLPNTPVALDVLTDIAITMIVMMVMVMTMMVMMIVIVMMIVMVMVMVMVMTIMTMMMVMAMTIVVMTDDKSQPVPFYILCSCLHTSQPLGAVLH